MIDSIIQIIENKINEYPRTRLLGKSKTEVVEKKYTDIDILTEVVSVLDQVSNEISNNVSNEINNDTKCMMTEDGIECIGDAKMYDNKYQLCEYHSRFIPMLKCMEDRKV